MFRGLKLWRKLLTVNKTAGWDDTNWNSRNLWAQTTKIHKDENWINTQGSLRNSNPPFPLPSNPFPAFHPIKSPPLRLNSYYDIWTFGELDILKRHWLQLRERKALSSFLKKRWYRSFLIKKNIYKKKKTVIQSAAITQWRRQSPPTS